LNANRHFRNELLWRWEWETSVDHACVTTIAPRVLIYQNSNTSFLFIEKMADFAHSG
jgi:hypothetical protein